MSGTDLLHAATISPQVLVSQAMPSAEAALLTVAPATSVKIAQGSICNITGSAVNVFLSIIKTGGTMGDGTHRVIANYALGAYDTLALKEYLGGAMLGPGDSIAGYAATANAVDIVLTGTVQA